MMPTAMLLLCAAYFVLAALAVNLGYHRVLSHRAAVLAPWFERLIITLGLPAGTPIQWAGNHRQHHAFTDRDGDPHSPLHGFWHSHVGWYIGMKHWLPCLAYALAGPVRTLIDGWHRPRSNQQHCHLAADIAADPYYRFVSRPAVYLLCAVTHVAVFYGLAFLAWGGNGVATLWVTQGIVYNLGDAIDSVGHLIGERPFPSRHLARNHWWLGYFTLGEWHANHHQFPSSANTGLFPGQFDGTYQMCVMLEALGLAKNVKRVPPDVVQGLLARGGAKDATVEGRF